jgi:O-antigen/teichoic acid export membrane protein
MNFLARLTSALDDPELRKVLVNGALALTIKVLAAALSLFMFIAFARSMTPTEYGKFAFGFSLAITLSTFAGLGFGTAVLRFLPQYLNTDKKALARGFLVSATLASLIVPVFVGLILVVGIYVSKYFSPNTDLRYLVMVALLIPLMAASEFVANALRSNGQTIASMAPRDILWRVFVIAITYLAIRSDFRLDSQKALLASSFVLLAVLIGQLVYAYPSMKHIFGSTVIAFDYPLWAKTLVPMWGAATLYALVQQFDVVVLGTFISPEQSGAYFAALRTASMLGLLLIAGNMISAPLIARYYHANDHVKLQKLVSLLTAGIAIPTLFGFGTLALSGGWLLGLFDESFVSAYPFLLILGVGFTFDAVAGPTGYMLQMIGKESTYLKIMAGAYLLTFSLQCIMIPIFGLYGAAIPNALGIIVANIFIIRVVRRELGVDPSLLGLFSSKSGIRA